MIGKLIKIFWWFVGLALLCYTSCNNIKVVDKFGNRVRMADYIGILHRTLRYDLDR